MGMVVTCPPGTAPGSTIQVVAAPAGVPISTAGVPISSAPNAMLMHGPPQGYVEVDEISPSGWFCLVAGCFFCPGFNLLGLCMRERRLGWFPPAPEGPIFLIFQGKMASDPLSQQEHGLLQD